MSYTVRCAFCKREHVSEFFDDIQEEILACRDRAPKWQRGDLEAVQPETIRTVDQEVDLLSLATALIDFGVWTADGP